VNKAIVTIISILAVNTALVGCVSQPSYLCSSNIPQTTPTSRFDEDRTYGVVFDNKSKLTWKVCAEGQSYSDGHCMGTASKFTWENAMQAFGDKGVSWRMPNVDELNSIVEGRCLSPSINTAIFPNTPPTEFWTTSLDDAIPSKAWYVSFTGGDSNSSNKSASHNIRLVRGEDPKVSEERHELILELMAQNRIEELLKQEKDAEQDAAVHCSTKAHCDRLFSLAHTYITSEASKKIKFSADNIIESYEPTDVGDIGMTAVKVPGTGDSAVIRLSVSCMIFGSDIIIENLKVETEPAEKLRSKMKTSKISCLSKKISVYRDFRSFVDEK